MSVELMSTTSYYAVTYKGEEYTVCYMSDENTGSEQTEVTAVNGESIPDDLEDEILDYFFDKR
jgi:hypothetical protein